MFENLQVEVERGARLVKNRLNFWINEEFCLRTINLVVNETYNVLLRLLAPR